MKFFIILTVLFGVFCTMNEAIPVKTFLRVQNQLGGPNLTIHCSSSEDDLGIHVLVNDMYFDWHFRPNVWGSTKFKCDLQWEHGSGTYTVYKNDYVQLCPVHCYWYVKPEGPCLQSDEPDRQFCSPWQGSEAKRFGELDSGGDMVEETIVQDIRNSHFP
ncbi:unnamed protein product [Ilex paraguariensis]|uniref:S-protein homolog n=1 Tax=Ilex paraguariensis TaxID=185542 RepID=A0ABC8V332_9AQUA